MISIKQSQMWNLKSKRGHQAYTLHMYKQVKNRYLHVLAQYIGGRAAEPPAKWKGVI